MKSFRLLVVTPEGVKYDGEAVQLSVRASGGSMSVEANHIPLITSGKCRIYKDEGNFTEAECSGGLLSVGKDQVRVLCSFFTFK